MPIQTNSLLVKNLVDYGLSEKEAKIYIGLLELGSATVSEIAKNTGINRSSAYVVLESLKKQGLVGTTDDNKIQRYVATSPEALIYTIESQVRKQEEIRSKIHNVVPELKAISSQAKRSPKVRVFEGKQGLINALEDTLSMKEKVMRIFTSSEKILSIIPDYLPVYGKRRYEKGIKLDAIYAYAEAAFQIEAMLPHLYHATYIPKDKYPFSADLAIYDDKIGYMFADKQNVTTIIIENKEIAEIMKGLFDMAKKESIRISKKVEERK